MPWKPVKVKGGYKVKTVAGPHKGRTHSKKPISHAKAVAQVRAMYANTKGE